MTDPTPPRADNTQECSSAEPLAQPSCRGCGRPYGAEYGFPDLVIPDNAWAAIAPNDSNGLLCPSCICARLHAKGIWCQGRFTSGPLAAPLLASDTPPRAESDAEKLAEIREWLSQPESPGLYPQATFLLRLLSEAEAAIERLRKEELPLNGHNAPCVICNEPCNSLAANPALWPVRLDNAGWRHTGCVNKLLAELSRLCAPSADTDAKHNSGAPDSDSTALLTGEGSVPSDQLVEENAPPRPSSADTDAMEEAQKVVQEWINNEHRQLRMIGKSVDDVPDLVEAFATALLARERAAAEEMRERAAKVADEDARLGRDDLHDPALKGLAGVRILAAERIAHAIRSLSPTPEKP